MMQSSGTNTDGFIASINGSLGQTLVRVNFHSRGV